MPPPTTRPGDRVRVTAQLIDGPTGGHAGPDRCDDLTPDVFALPDAITRPAVASIQTVAHPNTGEEPVERPNRPNLAAGGLTVRAWHLLCGLRPEAGAAVETLRERALAQDPESDEASMVPSLFNHHLALWASPPTRGRPPRRPMPQQARDAAR